MHFLNGIFGNFYTFIFFKNFYEPGCKVWWAIYGPQASRDSIRGKVIVVKSSKKIVLTKALPELPLKKALASTNSTH